MSTTDELPSTSEVMEHALALARVGGINAVTPDAVAERCRVSPDALPEALGRTRPLRRRTSVGCAAMLAARMGAALADAAAGADDEPDGEAVLTTVGGAYIDFALDEPGWFHATFFDAQDMVRARDAEARSPEGLTPFEYLEHAFDVLVREGRVPADDAAARRMTCWSGVHGFATLAALGPLRSAGSPMTAELAAQVLRRLVAAAVSPTG